MFIQQLTKCQQTAVQVNSTAILNSFLIREIKHTSKILQKTISDHTYIVLKLIKASKFMLQVRL